MLLPGYLWWFIIWLGFLDGFVPFWGNNLNFEKNWDFGKGRDAQKIYLGHPLELLSSSKTERAEQRFTSWYSVQVSTAVFTNFYKGQLKLEAFWAQTTWNSCTCWAWDRKRNLSECAGNCSQPSESNMCPEILKLSQIPCEKMLTHFYLWGGFKLGHNTKLSKEVRKNPASLS